MFPVATGAEGHPGGRTVVRHPQDPDPVRATKARGVLALGIVALCTAVTVGGIIPALLALAMARRCRAEMREARGFLTGGRLLLVGERLAWIAIVVVATVLVILAISGVLRLAPTPV
ncbi:MAG TPA: hypothetical protein VFZ32_14520 [Micromonosporaceae bacterium]